MFARRSIAAVVLSLVLSVASGAGCTDEDEPSPSSENRGEQLETPTSGNVPPGNPESGETGTDGTDTGSG